MASSNPMVPTPRTRAENDLHYAYRGIGNVKMAEMRAWMKKGNLNVYKKTFQVAPDVFITCHKCFSFEEIKITSTVNGVGDEWITTTTTTTTENPQETTTTTTTEDPQETTTTTTTEDPGETTTTTTEFLHLIEEYTITMTTQYLLPPPGVSLSEFATGTATLSRPVPFRCYAPPNLSGKYLQFTSEPTSEVTIGEGEFSGLKIVMTIEGRSWNRDSSIPELMAFPSFRYFYNGTAYASGNMWLVDSYEMTSYMSPTY